MCVDYHHGFLSISSSWKPTWAINILDRKMEQPYGHAHWMSPGQLEISSWHWTVKRHILLARQPIILDLNCQGLWGCVGAM